MARAGPFEPDPGHAGEGTEFWSDVKPVSIARPDLQSGDPMPKTDFGRASCEGTHPVPRPLVAVLAVVVRDGHVILARRANPPDVGLWGFPGGKIEWGETIEDAAVRELREETGVVARASVIFAVVDALSRETGSVEHHFILIAVLCRWISGDPVAGDDILDCRWVDRETLLRAEIAKSDAVEEVADKAFALVSQRS